MARRTLRALAEDDEVRKRHPTAVYLLLRALAVDVTRDSNRKGELPAALGLLWRGANRIHNKHQAIITMIDMLQDRVTADPDSGNVYRPYLDFGVAADAVVEGFYKAGIDTKLTAANVRMVYRRLQRRDR